MKKIFFFIFLLASLAVSQNVEAKGVVVYHNGPKVSTVAELPAELVIDGRHVNLGVLYEQFGVFWLPVWNYGDVKYVLVADDEETYWDMTSEDLSNLKAEFPDIEIADTPSLPLWQKVGIKPVIVILLLLIIWGYLPGKRKNA